MTVWIILAAVVVLTIASIPVLKFAVPKMISHKATRVQVSGTDPLLASLQPGKPALVYFTSPGCGPCRLTQRPIIETLTAEKSPDLQILTLNIEDDMEATLRWGVMQVPRTFVLDHNLRPYATNMGIATRETLLAQIAEAESRVKQPTAPIRVVAGHG
jgi:thiol-disulfide isomerase/thioredoxin